MNDTDKDLISAYLDGETNASESAQVEALLDSDPEAFEYSNQLKQSKLEINGFFKGASMDSLEQSVDNFIAERSASNSNSDSALPRFNFGSLSAGIASMLSPSRAVGAMAAFAVVGVLVLPTIFQSEFDDPDMKIFTVPVTRSATLENSSLSCSSSLSMMLDSKSSPETVSGRSIPISTSFFFLVESMNELQSILMTHGSILSPSN